MVIRQKDYEKLARTTEHNIEYEEGATHPIPPELDAIDSVIDNYTEVELIGILPFIKNENTKKRIIEEIDLSRNFDKTIKRLEQTKG